MPLFRRLDCASWLFATGGFDLECMKISSSRSLFGGWNEIMEPRVLLICVLEHENDEIGCLTRYFDAATRHVEPQMCNGFCPLLKTQPDFPFLLGQAFHRHNIPQPSLIERGNQTYSTPTPYQPALITPRFFACIKPSAATDHAFEPI